MSTPCDSLRFPASFVWGTSTASYQIEGAHDADGKSPSIWDVFAHRPGNISSGYTLRAGNGDVACDHYHRFAGDVALMRDLGINAYRLSLSWPRILPGGTGRTNPAGIAFYRRLLTALREAGITPWVTLYHWDLPQSLQQRGGWLNPESALWFSDYAAHAARELGDLVDHWITFNEPQCFIGLGYVHGEHAPGWRLPFHDAVPAAHNALRAHGAAVQALRANAPRPCRIGWAPMSPLRIPHTENAADIEAARQRTFASSDASFWSTSWFLDPVYLGTYPEDGLRTFAPGLPTGWENDLAAIRQPLDFCGINLYTAETVRAGDDGAPVSVPYPDGFPISRLNQAITPEVLYWGPRFLHQRYGLPVVITENGFADSDWVQEDGSVSDPKREDYLRRHLRALARAVAEGIPTEGYFHWSFMDNFEWGHGFKERFGLVHVDFPTQKRTPKSSFHAYRDIIRGAAAHQTPGALTPPCRST